MGPLPVSLIVGGVSGGLSAISARKDRQAANRVIEARQAIFRKQIEDKKRAFEISTYSKYVDRSMAGAAKMQRQLLRTGSRFGVGLQNKLEDLMLERNINLGRYALDIEIDRLNAGIKALDAQHKRSRFAENFLLDGFTTGLKTYANLGGFNKKPKINPEDNK